MLRLMAVGLAVVTVCVIGGQAFADNNTSGEKKSEVTKPETAKTEDAPATAPAPDAAPETAIDKAAPIKTDLSLALLEDETPETSLPLDPQADKSMAAKATGLFKSDPYLWGTVGLILSFLGFRGIRGGINKAAEICSPGEVFGMTFLTGGVGAVTVGLANAIGWSPSNCLMMTLGSLVFLFGIGFTAQANQERIKGQS